MKVPLKVSWLSEEGLLEAALALRGEVKIEATPEGVLVQTSNGPELDCWNDTSYLFTLSQLKELGFE